PPLERALVKVTRPGADLPRESLAFRLERLERGAPAAPPPPRAAAEPEPAAAPEPPSVEGPSLELEQLQEAWRRTILPAVEERSVPTAVMLAEAHPAGLEAGGLTLEVPPTAPFLRRQAAEARDADALPETPS